MKNWKFKKTALLGLLIVLLSGCRTNDGLTEENSMTNPLGTNGVETLDVLPFIVGDQESNNIVLIDLLTNERLAEFLVEEDQMIVGLYSFPSNYYGALVVSGIDGEEGSFSLRGEENLIFFVLDASLNLTQTFEIRDEQLSFEIWSAAVVFVDEEILIYYHDFMFGQGLYVYNATTNSRSLVMEVESDFILHQIESTSSPDRLAFRGSRLRR